MRAGQLRHRLELWAKQPGRDSNGEEVENWVKVATVWGALEPLSSREFEAGDKEHGQITHRIRVRAQALQPKPHQQIRFQGRVFDLDPGQNVAERDRELILPARELVQES